MLRFPRRFTLYLLPLVLASAIQAATFPSSRPSTTNNDDSCDIAVLPAATLLLPHFLVDLNAPVATARTTLFTVINTVREPQIARVTIWTDLAFPLFTFDVFLTGYDAQAFNLYDLIGRGVVNEGSGSTKPTGSRSATNNANPNFLPGAVTACQTGVAEVPLNILADIQMALTQGTIATCGNARIGNAHAIASGYITIDVVATCSSGKGPNDAGYFDELLYDNVLTGDYEYLAPNPATGNYAGGSSMVHIRAVPEGGRAGENLATGLPYTFYDRFTPAERRTMDRRQPLPATFVARFIQGGPTAFDTEYQIWREGTTRRDSLCTTYTNNNMPFADVVRFDERENPTTHVPQIITPPMPIVDVILGASERLRTASNTFPMVHTSGDVGGWMYLNLNNGGSTNYSSQRNLAANSSTLQGPRPSQNWVTVSMFAEGRYSVTFDATMLSNGCSPAPSSDSMSSGGTVPPIGPGPNELP